MDLQNNMQPELGKLEQIVYQFLLKCLHVILDSRVPLLRPHDRSGDLYTGSRVRRSDKWFNLALGDRPSALDNLHFWHRNLMDPMIIDIILVHEVNGSSVETVIERWVVQYECPLVVAPHTGDITSFYKKTYQKSIVLFRALYSQMRLLPAYKIFRQLGTSSHTCNFDIVYKVSSFSDPFSRAEGGIMEEYNFAPVEALPGRLCISVTYRTTLSDFNLECSTSLPTKIITDYVGSPNTDPLRSFPASEKGVRATSFPVRGIAPPSSTSMPLDRPHSWTCGFHKAAPFVQNHPYVGSPPVYRASPKPYDFPSPPTDSHGVRMHNYRMHNRQRSTSYDEYQLSPPFSPSPSPSPPTYFYAGNPIQTRVRSESAPVTIPHPHSVMGKSSRNLSPNFSDPSRNSLPPLSPRRNDGSSQESASGIRSLRKLEASRTGQKIVKDSKDDSGRFSGLLSSSGSPRIGFSRTSSRLSFQDDLDDGDFSCPFDVDDVDIPDVQSSHNADGKSAAEITSTSLPMGKKSQDAAVGVLVHMLRTAPPLRQDPSCYSSQSPKADLEGGVATASGFFMPRKTADALEELRSYKEMRDFLLSKSGTRILNRDEAKASSNIGFSSRS
ncbi:autophagy-related protein 13a [Abrus precatorius]|uniref:Autophagy-related protein 13a n=1 Tax=Abrus precatorius TaxID=3816 RepID=A0A8B8JIC1_ABRPR|nr:autophagy-related protein 13a [Abrus precatorius]XP_027331207.1 autophagy-related protein 13a [Abrus precatorius]